MAALPYFPWYPADAESDERYVSLTLQELGLHHRALNHSWTNRSVPSTIEGLARALRLPIEEVKAAWPAVKPLWAASEQEGRLVSPRQETERSKAESKSQKAAIAGAASGYARRLRAEQTMNQDPAFAERSPELVTNETGTSAERTFNGNRTEGVPRAYPSPSPSGSSGGVGGITPMPRPVRREIPGTLQGLTAKEFNQAWERHHKRRGNETQNLAAQVVLGLEGFDVDVFRARHGEYCAYWDEQGWNNDYGNALTFISWLQNGMPPPPPAARKQDGLSAILANIPDEETEGVR